MMGHGESHEDEAPPLTRQVGGDHYKSFEIQPVEYIMGNRLNFLQGCIIKRIPRYNQPTGKGLQDLEKIKHEVERWKDADAADDPPALLRAQAS